MDDIQTCGINIEQDNENTKVLRESSFTSDLPLRRQLNKKSFKSLTVLNESSSENLQKIRRCNFFGRVLNAGEKRSRKKFYRKKFYKSNVSEVNIRKVTNENEKLVNIIGPWKLFKKPVGKDTQRYEEPTIKDTETVALNLNDNVRRQLLEKGREEKSDRGEEKTSCSILQCFEKLRLGESSTDLNSMHFDKCGQDLPEAKTAIDYSSGDVQQDFGLDLNLRLPDEKFANMACAQIFDSKRRSVQWKREVDVIYYAGDSNGGTVVRRENEPLREETEQQSRRNKFIRLAVTKKLLSNMSVCQLRDPWLFVLPK